MPYTFEILGVSPILQFFNYQQTISEAAPRHNIAYVGSFKCTLDALLESVDTLPLDRGWNLDQAVDTVISFWVTNFDSIHHWKRRLEDAGDQNLLIARLANFTSLQDEFERLFRQT